MAEWTAFPSADTFIYEFTPDDGFGTQTTAITGFGSAAGLRRHALFRFDLSSFPGGTINSVVLDLRVTSIAGVTDIPVTVYGLTEGSGAEFEEEQGAGTEASWNSFATGQAWSVAGGAVEGVLGKLVFSSLVFTGLPDVSISIIDLVEAAVDAGYTTLGLLFQMNGSGANRNITFASREDATEANRPLLIIQYTEGSGDDGLDRPDNFTRIDMARRTRRRKLVWVRFNRL